MSRTALMWSVCCVVFVIVVVIIVLIAIFVVAPSFAQTALNNSIITIDAMDMHETGYAQKGGIKTPFIKLRMKFTAYNTNSLAAETKPTTGHIVYGDNAFAEVAMPAMKMKAASETHFDEETTMYINDYDAFTEFGGALMQKEYLTIKMKATVTAYSPSFGFTFTGLKLDKEITVRGLGAFKDPAPIIEYLSFVNTVPRYDENPAAYPNVIWGLATAILPNPSVASVTSIGELECEVWTKPEGGLHLGRAFSTGNVSVARGYNNSLSVEMMVQGTNNNEPHIREMFAKYIDGTPQTVYIRGKNSTDPIWTGPVSNMVAGITMNGLTNTQEKMFVSGSAMLNASFSNLIDQHKWASYKPYCSKGVPDYDESISKTCSFPAWTLRLVKGEFVGRNPLGLDVSLTELDFNVSIVVPQANGSVEYPWFGWGSSDLASQARFDLYAHEQLTLCLALCVAGTMTVCDGFLPVQGRLLQQCHDSVFANMLRFYPDSNTAKKLYDYTAPGQTPVLLALVHGAADMVSPILTRLNGTVTVTAKHTGFSMSGVRVVQDNVPLMFRYYNDV